MKDYDELGTLISPMSTIDAGETSGRGDEYDGNDLELP